MRTARALISILSLCGATSTLTAESLISYKIELGGDNHAAAWKNPADCTHSALYPVFTGGSDLDNQFVCVGHAVTWSVRVAVSGVHSSGAMPRGAANLVASLELYKDGVLTAVSANGPEGRWLSTINNGVAGTRQTVCDEPADPVQLAAFPVSWSIDGSKYGRVIDGPDKGGPLGGTGGSSTAYWQYPSAAGYPAGSTAPPGTLMGMGAGYANFIPTDAMYSGAGGNSTPGIGVTTATDCALALGTGPVFEGQLDTAGMAAGTYVLKVVPGTGNNILVIPQDPLSGACEYPNDTAFAVETDASAGDTITFIAGAGCWQPPSRTVVGRHIFYHGSYFGGAIAADKTPLLPGQMARRGTSVLTNGSTVVGQQGNYITCSKSLTGLYIDMQHSAWGQPLSGPVPVSNFEFARTGRMLVDARLAVAAPLSITAAPHPTLADTDRIAIVWADNALPNANWIRIRVKSDANGGTLRLQSDDVFYVGIAIGDGLNDPANNVPVDLNDQIGPRAPNSHPSFLRATITDVWDFNKDSLVDLNDQVIPRAPNATSSLTCLVLGIAP